MYNRSALLMIVTIYYHVYYISREPALPKLCQPYMVNFVVTQNAYNKNASYIMLTLNLL
jgi:hypothetical protein